MTPHEARTHITGNGRHQFAWTTRCTCGWESPVFITAEESRVHWRAHALDHGDSAA